MASTAEELREELNDFLKEARNPLEARVYMERLMEFAEQVVKLGFAATISIDVSIKITERPEQATVN